MSVDTPQVQRGIAKWTLIAAILLGGLTYLLGAKLFAYGLVFGVVLTIVNYRVIGWLLEIALREASPGMAKILSFVSYHVRFWIIVVILYLIIPKTSYLFGVGLFTGVLLPKMIMGIFVVLHTDDEWWNRKTEPARTQTKLFEKKKGQSEGIRFPGLDFDERYKNDERFKDEAK